VGRNIYALDNIKLINRLAFLIAILSVFITISSGIYYIVQHWFKIERITIEGNTAHITTEQLSYIAKNRLKGTFFTLDIDSLQHEFRQIPWVKSVTVVRNFPDTITVNVKEFDVIARFGDDGLIASDGNIFNGADDNPLLPIFIAMPSQLDKLMLDYKEIKPLMAAKNINLTKLELNGAGITNIWLSNNLHIAVCNSDIKNSLQVLTTYWDKFYQINPELSYINMCYKNAVAINKNITTNSERGKIK